METGFIIKRLREAEAISQVDLADNLGVSRVYLSQIENGHKQASFDLLRKIARTFKIPIALLVAWDENNHVESRVLAEMQELFIKLLNQQLSRRMSRIKDV